MKKFILFTFIITPLIADDSLGQLNQLTDLVNKQETQWLNWMTKKHSEKNDVLIADLQEMTNHKKEYLKSLAEISSDNKNSFIEKKLKSMFELYDKHRNRMNEFWSKKCSEGKELYLEQEKELIDLKKSFGLIKDEASMPDAEEENDDSKESKED